MYGAQNVSVVDKTNEWMNIMVQGNSYYRDIYITNNDGICISSSNASLIKKNHVNEMSVQNALSGMFSINNFAVGLISKKMTATLAGPIDIAGDIVGSLLMNVDFPEIVSYQEAEGYSKNIFSAIINPSGLFMVHRDKSIMNNQKILFPKLYEQFKISALSNGVLEYSLDGKPYIGFAKFEPISNCVIVSSGLKTEVFSAALKTGVTVLGISLIGICLISAIVIRFVSQWYFKCPTFIDILMQSWSLKAT